MMSRLVVEHTSKRIQVEDEWDFLYHSRILNHRILLGRNRNERSLVDQCNDSDSLRDNQLDTQQLVY